MLQLIISDTAVRIMMWVAGGLLTVIFFFFTFYFTRSIRIQDELRDAINKLQMTLTGTNAIVMAIKEESERVQAGCAGRHVEINERFAGIDGTIKDHGERISRVEAIVELKL